MSEFTETYASALQDYLEGAGEAALLRAYDLGRRAIAERLGILQMAAIYQETLDGLLKAAPTPGEGSRLSQRAARFYQESLAPFEMIQRSYLDAQGKLRSATPPSPTAAPTAPTAAPVTGAGVPGEFNIIGASAPMEAVFDKIRKFGPSEATVLVRGESGTGKELAAAAIHRSSTRAGRPFLSCNCGAIPEGLAESELFGHEKGAFTGAVASKKGLFEQAHTGTLFLDEVGELDPRCQVKLLRVLESRSLRRVGGIADIAVDVRILAATNGDLAVLVKQGRFREDLYYRLHVLEIYLPPLRDRKDDIPLIAEAFLRRFARANNRTVSAIEPAAMDCLRRYPWPGNVREMKNCIERAVILGAGPRLGPQDIHLPSSVSAPASADSAEIPSLREVERRTIVEVLDRCRWNRSLAAEKLGIQRSTLYEKIKAYEIQVPS